MNVWEKHTGDKFHEDPVYEELETQMLVYRVLSLVDSARGRRVINTGAGNPSKLKAIKKAKVLHFDAVPRFPGVEKHDIAQLPHSPPADVLVCCRVLSNINPLRQRDALGNIRNSLSPGGVAIIVDVDWRRRELLQQARLSLGKAPLPDKNTCSGLSDAVLGELGEGETVAGDYIVWSRLLSPVLLPFGSAAAWAYPQIPLEVQNRFGYYRLWTVRRYV